MPFGPRSRGKKKKMKKSALPVCCRGLIGPMPTSLFSCLGATFGRTVNYYSQDRPCVSLLLLDLCADAVAKAVGAGVVRLPLAPHPHGVRLPVPFVGRSAGEGERTDTLR